jgi:hypothetical protein
MLEQGSGFWATPNTMDHLPPRSPEAMAKHLNHPKRKGQKKPENLREQVDPNTIKMWPTPAASQGGAGEFIENLVTKDGEPAKPGERAYLLGAKWPTHITLQRAVKMWPTPSTRDHKGGYIGGRVRDGKTSWDTLDVAVQHTDNQEKKSGSLNPQWVEWLMGFPIGHTDLKV